MLAYLMSEKTISDQEYSGRSRKPSAAFDRRLRSPLASSPGESLYLVLNSTGGLHYNVLQSLAGRLRGFRQVVHHHVWSYLSVPDWRMRLLVKILKEDSIHVVACPEMAEMVRMIYGSQIRVAYLTPSIIGKRLPLHQQTALAERNDTFVLGHLSNLTMEKGVGCYRYLRQVDRDGNGGAIDPCWTNRVSRGEGCD